MPIKCVLNLNLWLCYMAKYYTSCERLSFKYVLRIGFEASIETKIQFNLQF